MALAAGMSLTPSPMNTWNVRSDVAASDQMCAALSWPYGVVSRHCTLHWCDGAGAMCRVLAATGSGGSEAPPLLVGDVRGGGEEGVDATATPPVADGDG